ncbi:tetratricopeptide repeat protein, partial [Eubacteriales bacterium OttesenSCG-928-A19]|nr:tetratricopeptide repeat protein [Eubacteriales bacterium OttesenSCG-928-A19]
RAMAQSYEGNYAQAIDIFDEILAGQPDHLDALSHRAQTLLDMGAYDEAIKDLLRIHELGGATVTVYEKLAYAYRGMALYEDALSAYDAGLALEPVNGTLLYAKGALLLEMGRHEDALAYAQAQIEKQPDAPAYYDLRGQAYEKLEQPAEAMASYEKATELSPDEPQHWINLARAQGLTGQYEDALESAQTAQRLDPENEGYQVVVSLYMEAIRVNAQSAGADAERTAGPDMEKARHQTVSALMLLESGSYQEALQTAEDALRLAPEDAQLYTIIARANAGLGNTDDALAAHEKAVVLAPSDAGVWVEYARTLVNQTTRYDEVLGVVDIAMDLAPEDARLHNIQGVAYDRLGRYDEALDAFTEAAKHDPNDPKYQANVAGLLYDLGRYEEALQAAGAVIGMDTQDMTSLARAQNTIGTVRLQDGEPEQAFAAFEQATQLDPSVPLYWRNGTEALLALSRDEDALSFSVRGLEALPDDARLYDVMARANAALGHIDEALADHEKAVALEPESADLWLEYARTLANYTSRGQDALDAADRALSLSPDDARSENVRAVAYRKMGEPENALQPSTRAVELAPGDQKYWANHAALLYDLGLYEDALNAAQTAIGLGTADAAIAAHAYNTLGITHRQLGDLDDAVSAFQQATALSPDSSLYWRNGADALSELGRGSEALEMIDEALRLSPDNAAYQQLRERIENAM